jgi:hypothetical protein
MSHKTNTDSWDDLRNACADVGHMQSDAFADALPEEVWDLRDMGAPQRDESTFSDELADVVATAFQSLIASTIASLIDAGSERDAINEDEALHDALVRVLKDW